MRVVVAGGTGLLGTALSRALRSRGDDVVVLSRRVRGPGHVEWDPLTRDRWPATIDGADAVVNLAGEPLDAGRWTPARKQRLVESRVKPTQAIASVVTHAAHPPRVLLNASAIGIYGPRRDELVTEATPAGGDFAASLCMAWEREAMAAAERTRVVLLRTGLVLDRTGGALPRLELPIRWFAGGPIGSGDQWWSWIHVADWVALVLWALEFESIRGALNLTAPEPVTNRDFVRTLARALGRPAMVPAPGLALRIMFGEMADALILNGQRVVPQRALEAGFRFQFPTLDSALTHLYPDRH